MKTILLLIISLNTYSQQTLNYQFKIKEHTTSLVLTAIKGSFDGLRDASMFGRVKGDRWFNESLDSWKLKYKNQDYTKGAAYFGSTSIFVAFSDLPHASNTASHIAGDMAMVYMPNMTRATFWQKLKTAAIYGLVRETFHNVVNDFVFKRRVQ